MTSTTGSVNRIALACFGLGFCLFITISLFSFDISDWPNPDVAGLRTTHNLCGPAGAFLAYNCQYYLGPAVFPILIALVISLLLYCRQKPIDQKWLRTAGVILIGAGLSAGFFMINPGNARSLTIGNGGVLGIAFGHFLLTKTAVTGASLIIASTILVGLLLAADNFILVLLRFVLQTIELLLVRTRPALAGARIKSPPKSEPRDSLINKITALAPSRRDSAVAVPASLDDDEPKNELRQHNPDNYGDSKPVVDEASQDSDDIPVKSPSASRSSVQAVSSALAQMLGKTSKTTGSTNADDHEEIFSDYIYPPLDLLAEPLRGYTALQEKVVREKGRLLETTLSEFNIDARVVEAETGPVITMFELQLAPGIKVAQISNLSNDLARSLGAGAVRVVAPIPGKHTIGIEVPNNEKEKVRIKELLQIAKDKAAKMQIPLFLGKDASSEPLVADLTTLPHLLIAGTTGSGKSVCLNSIIVSILMTQRPDMVKLILVDPKMVEMNSFRDLAHLMCPIVTEMKRAEQILEWLCVKMDERYSLLSEARVRNIIGYNNLTKEEIYDRLAPSNEEEMAKIPLKLPYLILIIDELADLMMTSAKESESYIIRLAQKSRSVGIHIVLATQRPQATVVTGLIKSNLPSRISFRVAARMDSRIVLDQNGAEALLGQGDMLFLRPGTSDLVRAQGTFIDEEEIQRLTNYLRQNVQPHYHPELVQLGQVDDQILEKDELFDEAVRIILETRRGSVSLLQRRLTIGYSRASRLIDQMALAGIVGEYKGSQAREVLITPQEYEAIRRQMQLDADAGYTDMQEDEQDNDVEPSASNDISINSQNLISPAGDDFEASAEPVQNETEQ